MDSMRLSDVCAAVSGRLVCGSEDAVASGASIDSRSVGAGELFFSMRGGRTEGWMFIDQAAQRGAAAAIVPESAVGAIGTGARIPCIAVRDTTAALSALAKRHRSRIRGVVVGVTGSCGKTTTREMIHAVLSAHAGSGTRSMASLNNHLGVPLTLLRVQSSDSFAVVEMGASGPGEIRSLSAIAKPSVGVITNVRPAHLEGFGDLFGVARAKGELFESMGPSGLAVYNPAELGLDMIARRSGSAILTFGVGRSCHVRLRSLESDADGISMNVGGVLFRVPVLSPRLAWNALAAAAVGVAFGVPLKSSAEALAGFAPPQGRLTRRSVGGLTMIYDAYNANPASVRAAIEALNAAAGAARKVLILGDMLELGRSSMKCHVEVGRAAAAVNPALTVSVGRQVSALTGAMIARGTPQESILWFEDAESAAAAVPAMLASGDLVLLKASRALGFEKIRDAIESRFSA